MVGLKGNSRRQKLSQKYNIDKKAREHRRKMKKKANSRVQKPGSFRKKSKLPTIPKLYPFREQELLSLQKKKLKAQKEKEKLRAEMKQARQAAKNAKGEDSKSTEGFKNSQNPEISGRDTNNEEEEEEDNEDENEDDEDTDIEHEDTDNEGEDVDGKLFHLQRINEEFTGLMSRAMKKQRTFATSDATSEAQLNASSTPGKRLFSKTFASSASEHREVNKLLEKVEVVVEVLDGRDPMSCRCLSLERNVISSGKRLILLMNKIDLIPRSAIDKWLRYLRKEHPTIAFKSSLSTAANRSQYSKAAPNKATDSFIKSNSHVFGASTLLQLLKNYSRSGTSKLSLTVGIVGYPNVGKSSVINSLLRSVSVVRVGGEAGVTKKLQEVQLDEKIRLIDSPGVIFRKSADNSSLILGNIVKLSRVKDPESVVAELVPRVPKDFLLKFFKIEDFEDAHEFLSRIAYSKGKLTKGGKPDFVASARLILTCWTSGKMGYYCLPPQQHHQDDEALEKPKILTSFAPAFNELDNVWKDEEVEIKKFYDDISNLQESSDNVNFGVEASSDFNNTLWERKEPEVNTGEKAASLYFDESALNRTSRNPQFSSSTVGLSRIKKRRRRALMKAEGDEIANAKDIVEKHLISTSFISSMQRDSNKLRRFDALEMHSESENEENGVFEDTPSF